MVGDGTPAGLRAYIAAGREGIIQRYAAALRAAENPLGRVSDEFIAAGAVPVINVLTRADSSEDEQAVAVGRERARTKINPLHSLQAASLLYDAIGEEIRQGAHDLDTPGNEVADLLHELHASIMRRVEDAAIPYAQVLLQQISNAHAAERYRIASEVHDRAAHALALALQQLEMRSILVKRGDDDAAEGCLRALASNLKDASEMVRDIAQDLGSHHTEEGLPAALDAYVAAYGEGRVNLHIDGDGINDVPGWVREQAFLSVREAIRNAVRHSGAEAIDAHVTVRDSNLIMIVRDWGEGLRDNPEEMVLASAPGRGLRSITDRVEQLGGSVVFGSRQGVGTTVELVVPLP